VPIFRELPVEYLRVRTESTSADVLSESALPPLNWCFRAAIRLAGEQYPCHTSQYGTRRDAAGKPKAPGPLQRTGQIVFTNRFGFFHCISARKA